MDMSPFPDLSADFNNAFWNLETMGMQGNNFFDPMSSYFVPFNVDPPGMGDDGVFAPQASDAFGFGLGAGTPVDLDMLVGGRGHRQSVSGHPGGGGHAGLPRRGTGTGME
jgi:hypothetical protein